jgi:uncharacterized protein YjbJ (UPF0337 family)
LADPRQFGGAASNKDKRAKGKQNGLTEHVVAPPEHLKKGWGKLGGKNRQRQAGRKQGLRD